MITSEEAAQLYLDRIIDSAFRRLYQDIKVKPVDSIARLLDDPYELEQWYKSLEDKSKRHVLEMIRASMGRTIFNVLTILDNVTGGNPIRGQTSDFALYVQTYEDTKAMSINNYQEATRFNSLYGIELHDLFMDLLESEET